ncbi:MAG TPA: hypothetical protein ENI49_05105 [Thermoplasmatales archaeon]|nr:hypothetical protein [Thermoplasmatales archaeon]
MAEKKSTHKRTDRQLAQVNKKIDNTIKKIEEQRERRCFLLSATITPSLVEKIFGELINNFQDIDGKLDVIVDSLGGDIDAAYNLACLFQKYGQKELTFIVPRWAKSAATLIVCAGEEILMTAVAELGPLDPQITQINPLEERFEQFSPLHIQTTLELIREEYEKGNKDLAEGLLKRLQFPLTLGSFIKAHEIAEQYLVRLLKERMRKTDKLGASPEEIAKRLTREYADHGFCINIGEAKKIGLNVQEIEGELLDLVWSLYELLKRRDDLEREKREADIMKVIEKLPPEILEKIKSKIAKLEQERVK